MTSHTSFPRERRTRKAVLLESGLVVAMIALLAVQAAPLVGKARGLFETDPRDAQAGQR